jgi:toxin ParE1/3/4
MAEYRLSPAAERDLEGIWKYTRREWGLEQTDFMFALPRRLD